MDKIHHIAIVVSNIEKAIAWYTQRFDIEVGYQDETWALLKFDNLSLALVVASQHAAHFAIERSDAADFGPLKPHRDRTISTYMKDVDGNVVEVMLPEISDTKTTK